ncbi:MAG: bifunctional UDP-sugar hydrolase/5'-nucleotidase [Clostridia bacterium]|nr:bifunctional UDP-sugar hydrolase/5'-nucleotidase [Clostridia bacterium]
MRKLLAMFIALAMLCTLVPAFAEEVAPEFAPVVVLHTNDVHGHALFETGSWGYDSLAAVKDDLIANVYEVILLDAGDYSQGTPLVNLEQGKNGILFMNAVGYDAATVGNHEFDWGSDNLLINLEQAKFPVLCANMLRKEDNTPVLAPNTIIEKGGRKIGVFGLATPETMTKAHPDKVRGVTFLAGEELAACAQAQVDELKAAGCDFIICIGHLGNEQESEGNRSADVIANVEGINLFIDGHSHDEYMDDVAAKGEEGAVTRLVQTGGNLANIGVSVINPDGTITSSMFAAPQKGEIVEMLYAPTNAEIKEIVANADAVVNEELGKPFAKTEVMLNGERAPGVRTEETNLGDFCCDAILYAAKKAYGDNVVAALSNGGGIRASIQAGNITMLDMKTVFPFGNCVAVLEVTGAELLEALEAATWSTPDAIGAFPQVAGIVYTIDTSVAYEQGEQYPDSTYFAPAKPGSRVTIETVGGEPFALDAKYMIATNDFTAAGGDTYYAFKYAYATSGYNTQVALEDALVDYVQNELGGVVGEQYAAPQGRITVK